MEADHQGGQVHHTLRLSSFSCIMNVPSVHIICGNERKTKPNREIMYKIRNKTIIIIII